ncbi:MAG TPA: hypothetical protein VF171_01170 [Trueperaceae bacterium]
MATAAISKAKQHSEKAREMLQDAVRQLRQDVGEVDDPRAKALFETSAEVLIGLQTAFDHYEQGKEEAWRQ